MADAELAIVIAGRRGDWPGGPRTLTPRESTREPSGTLWFGAELDPDGDQVWFRITAASVGRMREKTAAATASSTPSSPGWRRAPSSACFRARLADDPTSAGKRTARVLAGYRRTAGSQGRGPARPFGAADLAAVLATCHQPRWRGRAAASPGRSPLSAAASPP